MCTTCLMYVQCIWCTANSTCHDRNVTTNLPLDTENVVYAAPDTSGLRQYDYLKWYNPHANSPGSRYGLDWYPWPK